MRFQLIRRKIREKNGSGMITPVVALLLGMMFLLLLSQFIYLYSMIMGISDYVQQAVVQTATSNAYNAYKGIRDGNSAAITYAGSGDWNEMVSTAEFSRRLEEMLELERKGNRLEKYKDGVFKYAISDISVYCDNVEVGHRDNSVRLTFKASVTAEISLNFLGATYIVKKPISLISYYMPRF